MRIHTASTQLVATPVIVILDMREMGSTTVKVCTREFFVNWKTKPLYLQSCIKVSNLFSYYKVIPLLYYTDVDECSDTQFNSCSENSKCVNAIGNYTCQCNEGYDGNGFNCSGEYYPNLFIAI